MLISLNLNSHTWLMATLLDSVGLDNYIIELGNLGQ